MDVIMQSGQIHSPSHGVEPFRVDEVEILLPHGNRAYPNRFPPITRWHAFERKGKSLLIRFSLCIKGSKAYGLSSRRVIVLEPKRSILKRFGQGRIFSKRKNKFRICYVLGWDGGTKTIPLSQNFRIYGQNGKMNSNFLRLDKLVWLCIKMHMCEY